MDEYKQAEFTLPVKMDMEKFAQANVINHENQVLALRFDEMFFRRKVVTDRRFAEQLGQVQAKIRASLELVEYWKGIIEDLKRGVNPLERSAGGIGIVQPEK